MAVTLTLTANNLPAIDSVLNAASHKPTMAPGAWISIMGKNFSSNTVQATSQRLSTALNGVSVQMSGTGVLYDLVVHYVSPTQINAFDPFEVSLYYYGPQGAKLRVTTATGTASSTVDCEAIAPAPFSWGTDNYATGTLSNGMMIGDDPGMSPASAGSMITVYGTGFGQTNPNSKAVNGPMSPHPLAAAVTATIGGVPAEVSWAGMIGMGLYQFNLTVPVLPGSGQYPLVVSGAGANSPTVMIPPTATTKLTPLFPFAGRSKRAFQVSLFATDGQDIPNVIARSSLPAILTSDDTAPKDRSSPRGESYRSRSGTPQLPGCWRAG